ncbi:MAG: PQQ-binding-like beta-propeller repeat protein [Dehalococcoidales bacterium]|nr:PQQ-binding-like beta-propeller repeat protein [Dehalococcoidales bacterium]
MGIRRSRKLLVRGALLLVVLILLGLVVVGCVEGTTVPKGWSGGTIVDGTLFIGSMEGKLVTISTVDGSRLRAVALGYTAPAAGFGCSAPAPKTVAIYGSPAVSDDLVYVGGYNGIVSAFAFDRDEPRWVYPRQGSISGNIVGGLTVAQGKVYFGSSEGKVYALDAAEGYKQWEFETTGKIWSTPAVDGNTLFIGSFDKKLYAIDASTGKEKWHFATEGAIVSAPVIYNNTVYVGSFDRYLYALDANDGSLKWKFQAENWLWAKPVVSNGAVYAASLGGKVYALNAESGDKLVEVDLGSPVSSNPVLAGNSVILATEDGVVYNLAPDSNQPRRLVSLAEKVYAPLSASQGMVYIHSALDKLYVVDAQSGAKREFNIK